MVYMTGPYAYVDGVITINEVPTSHLSDASLSTRLVRVRVGRWSSIQASLGYYIATRITHVCSCQCWKILVGSLERCDKWIMPLCFSYWFTTLIRHPHFFPALNIIQYMLPINLYSILIHLSFSRYFNRIMHLLRSNRIESNVFY